MVPLIDLARRAARLEAGVVEGVRRVLGSGRLLLGPELEAFEAEFARYCGAAHVVCVGSGTDALRLTIQALGLGPEDEVLVPALTAVPTVAAVVAAGATPVPVDVDPKTAEIDVRAAAAARTERTKLVVPVHLYGRPAPVGELAALGLPLLEDAAQAHGALDAPVAPSIAAAYSFYPTKNLGGIGDGGAVVTDDAELAEQVRLLRHHGMREQYVHDVVATNSRMSEVEAVALRVGLPLLERDNARRREVAARYRSAAPWLRWQEEHPRHAYHLCVLRTSNRAAVSAELPCQTGVHYPLAVTQQPAYAQFAARACPIAEQWAAECLTLPCFPELTDDEVDSICQALSKLPRS